MKKLFYGLMVLATLTLSGCENEGDYSTDFSGMWALVAGHYEDGKETYNLIDEVLSFEGGQMLTYATREDAGYAFKNGYMECSRYDLCEPYRYNIELNGNKCFVYYIPHYNSDDDGYIQIKGGILYWYEDGSCEMFKRIKGFREE